MFYFITYEYEGKVYEVTVRPEESFYYRLKSLIDAGAKILNIVEQKKDPSYRVTRKVKEAI